jgi:hypothetical protein
MSSDRRIIVVASDWHCGHKLGLFNPETELYEDEVDGVESKIDHELSVFQEYLWYDIWLKVIDQVKRLADGDPRPYGVTGKQVVDYDRWNGDYKSVLKYFSYDEQAQPNPEPPVGETIEERVGVLERETKALDERVTILEED